MADQSRAQGRLSPPGGSRTVRSNTADAHESKRGEQADVCSPLPSPPGATRESRQRRAETIAGSSHEERAAEYRSKRGHRNSIVQYIDSVRRLKLEEDGYLKQKAQGSLTNTTERVIHLPRGGTYVVTKCGPVQFGLPPETIKDSMELGLTLPVNYVLPKKRFHLQAGMNVAEFEFPAYYNFFFKRRRINIITTREVEPLIRTIFTETLLGPRNIEEPPEYSEEVPKEAYPDLLKEASYFKVNPFDGSELTVDTLLSFTYFEDGVATLDSGVQIQDKGEEYVIVQDGAEFARVSSYVHVSAPRNRKDMASSSAKVTPSGSPVLAAAKRRESAQFSPLELGVQNAFVPPYFGITMLGNSDGFDAKGTTTGFVLWMNRRGIMVDPPPHSGTLLRKHGISPRLISGVILTHCHADHDAGTFQKILEEGRVVLMTTQVIHDSFIRKYSAISGLDAEYLQKLFVFRPVLVGEETYVYGGHLQFFYSLHTIPCVGFAAHCTGKSMVYSADTFNDPDKLDAFVEKGLMSKERLEKLRNFPWHHDVILHEAGVPPIHTPMSTFDHLSEDVKKRLYIVHKPAASVVALNNGLKPALVGPKNSIVISEEAGPNFGALEILDVVGGIDMFSSFPITRGMELVQCAKRFKYPKGSVIIKEGSYNHTLFVILMGAVSVTKAGELVKSLHVGDHFGEMSIVYPNERCLVEVTAVTELEVIQFSKNEFLHLIRHTNCVERLKQLAEMQRSESWQVLCANSVLDAKLSSTQKTYLQSILRRREVKEGEVVWKSGESATEAVLIEKGGFVFERARDMQPFTLGAFVCDASAMLNNEPLSTTLVCVQQGAVYYLSKVVLLKFIEDNPGFQVMFMNRHFVE